MADQVALGALLCPVMLAFSWTASRGRSLLSISHQTSWHTDEPTAFEAVINLKTTRLLGLRFLQLSFQANEMIR